MQSVLIIIIIDLNFVTNLKFFILFCSESVASSSVVLLPFEAFILRSETSINKKAITNYYYYSVD